MARLDALLDPGVEQAESVLAGLLGRVHGVVGVTQQRVRVGQVVREYGDADVGGSASGPSSSA